MLQVAALLAATLLLAGCMPSQPVITPAPQPSTTPIFATDEDALAAATAAYAKYLEVSDLIRAEGGANPERIAEFVAESRLEGEVDSFLNFANQGRSTVGAVKFDRVELQQYSENVAGMANVVMYLCQDASAVRFIDSQGKDITPAEKPERQLFEITMVSSPRSESKLVLSGSELWSDDSGC